MWRGGSHDSGTRRRATNDNRRRERIVLAGLIVLACVAYIVVGVRLAGPVYHAAFARWERSHRRRWPSLNVDAYQGEGLVYARTQGLLAAAMWPLLPLARLAFASWGEPRTVAQRDLNRRIDELERELGIRDHTR